MPPRRSHKKSRAGCRRCKSRKIKCDEVHPRCGNCVKHGVACDFEHPAASRSTSPGAVDGLPPTRVAAPGAAGSVSPANGATTQQQQRPPQQPHQTGGAAPLYRQPASAAVSHTTPPTNRLLELRLMHHYISMTSKTLTVTAPITEEIWRDVVPQIAFAAGSQHLTDGILAVAALHLRSLCPHDQDIIRASHAYMASSLREYSEVLTRGINAGNAESLFLTSTLIAIQSTATRVFTKEESLGSSHPSDLDASGGNGSVVRSHMAPGGYGLPLSWFHSFQGVKAITAASWQWLRHSSAVIPIINSQPVLQLDFDAVEPSFFGHLLDGLDQELALLPSETEHTTSTTTTTAPHALSNKLTEAHAQAQAYAQGAQNSNGGGSSNSSDRAARLPTRQPTKQAYEHAVAVLNWAHKIPHKGSPLAFPATVSRRFVELVEERRPRALAIMASFFALLKCLDPIWWLRGMARREVLGIVSLFNSDYFDADVERQWWPHMEWAVRVALHDDRENPGYVPPDLWGANWLPDDVALPEDGGTNFVAHIEMLSQMASSVQSFPVPPPSTH